MLFGGYRVGMAGLLRRRNALVAFLRAFKPGSPGVGRRISAIPRLIKASLAGHYDGKGRLFLMLLAGLYILSPIDLIPELFIPFVGLIDDAFVATWLAGALLSETERFLDWEQRSGPRPPKVVKVVRGRPARVVRVRR